MDHVWPYCWTWCSVVSSGHCSHLNIFLHSAVFETKELAPFSAKCFMVFYLSFDLSLLSLVVVVIVVFYKQRFSSSFFEPRTFQFIIIIISLLNFLTFYALETPDLDWTVFSNFFYTSRWLKVDKKIWFLQSFVRLVYSRKNINKCVFFKAIDFYILEKYKVSFGFLSNKTDYSDSRVGRILYKTSYVTT